MPPRSSAFARRPRTLSIDIGGTHVKGCVSDRPERVFRFRSGRSLTPQDTVRGIRSAVASGRYDRVSVGYPGRVPHGRILEDPPHLGPGWVGYDFERAFRKPTRVVNDAAMQAVGSYRGGRMLFLGLGAGLGSASIVDGRLQPMELGHLPYKKGRTFEEYVGESARRRYSGPKWRREVLAVVEILRAALEPDYVVLGGGNVRRIPKLPRGVLRGDNANAFRGGFQLWDDRFDGRPR